MHNSTTPRAPPTQTPPPPATTTTTTTQRQQQQARHDAHITRPHNQTTPHHGYVRESLTLHAVQIISFWFSLFAYASSPPCGVTWPRHTCENVIRPMNGPARRDV